MGLSIWQIILVLVLIMLLFGRGKISDLMGDVAKGITSFKKGLKDDSGDEKAEEVKAVEAQLATPEVIEATPETVTPEPEEAPVTGEGEKTKE